MTETSRTPSLADDVAALRDAIKAAPNWDWRRQDALERLDRIAAQMPQPSAAAPVRYRRATNNEGWGIWLHVCGHSQCVNKKGGTSVCEWCGSDNADWRPLFLAEGQ